MDLIDSLVANSKYGGTHHVVLAEVLAMHFKGMGTTAIEQALNMADRPEAPRHWGFDPYRPTSNMVAYMLRKTLPLDEGRPYRRARRTRPIDMGGPRDRWLEFTPAHNP